MKKPKKTYTFSFDIGDTVWYKYGNRFVVEVIEVRKEGTIYRCGNPGTDDYWAFYESEIGTQAFFTKEEQEKAYAVERAEDQKFEESRKHGRWIPDGGFNTCSVCGRITMQPQLTSKTHGVCPFCEAIMDLKEE